MLQAFDQAISRLIGLEPLTDSSDLLVTISKTEDPACAEVGQQSAQNFSKGHTRAENPSNARSGIA